MFHKIIEEENFGKIKVYNKEFCYNNSNYMGACFETTFSLLSNLGD